MLGVLCERPRKGEPPRTRRWEAGLGYRFLPSHRHFVGTVEQKQRAVLGTEIRNRYHIFDFSASYQVNPRWSLNASMPVTHNYRNQLYSPSGEFRLFSQGDATFGFRRWMFRPPTESLRNISLGAAIKVPTGRYNATFDGLRNGQRLVATGDQSVQAGDGGLGFTADLNAYTPFAGESWLFLQGLYLFNPRNHNGVATFRTRRGETVMSVSDQYLLRGGVTRQVFSLRRLAWSFGLRLEGVPVRDLVGRSEGFRRPGYALSLDPGLMFNARGSTFSVSVPYAVRRERKRSVPDIANGTHGDAAFADYSIIVGFSRRF